MSSALIGFHGTDIDSAQNIIKTNIYIPSNSSNWFGEGVYFFLDCPPIADGSTEAEDWAKHVKKKAEWAVLKSKIEGNIVANLVDDVDLKRKFDRIRDKLLDKHLAAGKPLESFNDKIVFRLLAQEGKFDYVMALVDGAKSRGYYTYFVRRAQLQLCVKNLNCIKETTIVKTGKTNVAR